MNTLSGPVPDLWGGVDIGGTKTAVVLSRSTPETLSRVQFPTLPEQGPERVLMLIEKAFRTLLAQQGYTEDQLKAIGISCGGPLDRRAGLIQKPPNLPTWVNVPIVEILSRKLGIVCKLENDANAGALAEYGFGAGRGVDNMIFLTMGTGLGAGMILNQQLYRGFSGFAGEIGHIRLTEAGPTGHNKLGSAEGWASGVGIAQMAQRAISMAAKTGVNTFLLHHNGKVSAQDVAEAAKRADPLALQVIEESGQKLGMVLAILMDLLNPQKIVIGGMALRLGDLLLPAARCVAQREALPETFEACEILPAALGEQIGDIAALCVARGDC